MANKLHKLILAAGTILFAVAMVYLCFQYTDISTLADAVSDEYGFIPVMIKMKQALLGHDLKATFSYAFFNYGFLYFLMNTLLSWGFIGDTSSVGQVVIPRLVSAAAAVGTMIVVYRMARITMEKVFAVGMVGLLLTAPAIWGTGTPRREFLHVDDLADACVMLLETYDSSEIVNIGCGEDVTIRELADVIAEIVGYTGGFRFDSTKPDGTPRKLLDVSRINALGWVPQISLREGVSMTYADYLSHQRIGAC